MTEKPLKQPVVGVPVQSPNGGMSLELVEIIQRQNDAIRDLRARVAALEP